MRIVYPELVEAAFDIVRDATPIDLTRSNDVKAFIYKKMVAKGVIDVNGQPTQKAIDEGLVTVSPQECCSDFDTLEEMKKQYPVYAEYSNDHFKHTSEGWAVDAYVLRSLANKVLSNPNSTTGQQRQAQAMLSKLDQQKQ